jgi:hypothetical protein
MLMLILLEYEQMLVTKRTSEERCGSRIREESRKLCMYRCRQQFRNWKEVKLDGCRGDWGNKDWLAVAYGGEDRNMDWSGKNGLGLK